MSSTMYVDEANLLPSKNVDFALVTDTTPRSFYARQPHRERAKATDKPSFDETELQAFHEEFSSLVLADDELFEIDWAAEWGDGLGNLNELNRGDIAANEATNGLVAAVVKANAPQQVVRPLTESQLGRPLPIETWVVKIIVVLVALNLLFAGMIVAGVRLSDLFK